MDPKEYNLEIRESKIAGLGCFTTKKIKKGTEICPFVGEEMTYNEFKSRYGTDYRGVYRRMPWQKWIVCKDKRNVISYVNDGIHNQPDPSNNCVLRKGSLYAIKDIELEEELTLSYGQKYWHHYNQLCASVALSQ